LSTSSPGASWAGVSRSLRSDLALDALEQAVSSRCPAEGLVHHTDRGSQYLSIVQADRLAEAGIEASVGSVGDCHDNALAETINGLFKTEVIRRRGPWRTAESVEFAVLEWVDWFNNRRILKPLGLRVSEGVRRAVLRVTNGAGHGGWTRIESGSGLPGAVQGSRDRALR